ncbi:hypothetical protein [Burkholderia sp. ABCPW 14]|uniref:hypothetical protein n=1 Tax=Burkholderia sp. ABCPW 14 TaxID=1637860 RepID=UPI0012E37AFC|nr:hypothetical protein [Burkholderia sp. ABCPW 14]
MLEMGERMAGGARDELISRKEAALLDALLRESERAVVVLGAAKVDADLEDLIKRVLIPSESTRDRLFDQGNALSSFGAKISLAQRLGIIDAEFASVLQTIRRIRNDFAHNATESDLSLADHRERVGCIAAWAGRGSDFHMMMRALATQSHVPELRKRFIAGLVTVILVFYHGRLSLKKIDVGGPLQPNEWIRLADS